MNIKDKMKNLNNKGITLITLVITIIILIILAGVAINLTVGENGIFNKAKYAKEQYQMAVVKEEIQLAIVDIQSGKLGNNEECTIDTIISELPSKLEGLTISKDGDVAKGTYNGYDFIIDEDLNVTIEGYNPSEGEDDTEGGGETTPTETTYTVTFNGTNVTSNGASTVKQNETYTATLTMGEGYNSSTVTITMGETTLTKGTDYTYTNGVITIQNVTGNINIVATAKIVTLVAGDYIKYNTGKEEIGDNGIVLCRILYNDETHGLQIITDKNITKKVDGVDTEIEVTLGVESDYAAATQSYNSAIETLNNEAEKYLNTAYAYDARCVGSAPTVEKGMFINKDKVKFEGTTEYVVPGETNYVIPYFTNTNYISSYGTDINYEDDKIAMEAVEIWTTGEVYWLASRFCVSFAHPYQFGVRCVEEDDTLFDYDLTEIYANNGPVYGMLQGGGLRPCFSLKSGINITEGDGKTEGTAYTIE